MKPFLLNAKMLSIFIMAFVLFGCADDEEENIPKVTAGFTHTIEKETGTVTFLNVSTNASRYLWDFGDETTSTEINPVKTYKTGTYTVTLTARNVAGGSDVFADTLNIVVPEPASLPITFDEENVIYEPSTFDGASFEIVDNPDVSGSNDKESKVGAITNSGAAYEGIYFDLGEDVDLAVDQTIVMNLWSDTPVDVLLKLEEGSASAIETTASHGGTGWEQLAFDYSSTDKYGRITLFVDGPGTTSGTFYLDDILQEATICRETDLKLPINFDCEGTNYDMATVNGASFQVIDNPQMSGINSENTKVGELTTTGSAGEGGKFTLDQAIDLNTVEAITMKMYASAAIDVTVKLEGGSTPLDAVASHTGSGWELLTFNYTSTESYDQLSVLLDDAGTFYLDDIMSGSATDVEAPVITLNGDNPVTLTDGASYVEPGFTATDNEDGDITGNVVVGGDNVDPDTPGTYEITYNVTDAAGNAADEVVRTVIVRFNDGLLVNGDFEDGAANWIGNAVDVRTEGGNSYNFANVTVAGNAYDVNLSQVVEIQQGTDYILSFDASSDRNRTMLAGIGLNEAPFSSATETVNLTTTTQTFTLNLSATDFGIPNSRVLFDMGADVGVVVIDNVSLFVDNSGGGGGGGAGGCTGTPVAATALPLDFEGCETFLSSQNFGAGITSELTDNPSKTGINTSDYVLRVDKPTGSDFYAGIQNTFASNFDLTTTNTFKLKVYSTKPNVVFRFELALNPQTDPVTGNPAPVFKTITNANEWTEVEFTFTGLPGGPTAYNQLVIKPDNDEMDSPIASDGTYYLDDLRLEAASGGGGGGGGGSEIINLTFSDASSINDWVKVADATGSEASIDWISNGGVSGGGAMQISAANPSDAAGKAYIFQLDASSLDYGSANNVRLTFDLKLAAPLVAAAVHLQTNIPGVGVVNNFDLQNNGLNDSAYTSYTFDFSGVDPGATTFTIHFNFASGAVTGAGGSLLVDNIKLVQN